MRRTQLSTLQASAAETPELEPRQIELQARVEGLEAQFNKAAAGSAKVRAIMRHPPLRQYLAAPVSICAWPVSVADPVCKTMVQATADMDNATTRSQLKNKELAELQAEITCALRIT